MYDILLLTFATGFLTKFADLIVDDGLKVKMIFAYAMGAAYGIIIAYIITTYPLLAPLGLAMVLAVLLTKKIDRKPHNIGIASMFLFLGLWGFPQVDMILLAVFLIAGGMDEIGNDLADQGRLKRIPAKLFSRRIVTDASAFVVSLLTGYWIIFFGILSFDVGYFLSEVVGKRFK